MNDKSPLWVPPGMRRQLKPVAQPPKPGSFDILLHDSGNITIKFPQAVQAATFTPEQALALAEKLISMVTPKGEADAAG